MKLTGVVKNGRRVYDNPAGPIIALQDIGEGRRFVETIERERSQRSIQQNKRHWSLVVSLWQEAMRQQRGLAMSADQVHDMLCRAFIGVVETPYGPVRKESKTLTTEEFAHFEDQCLLALEEQWPGFDRRSVA